ncbi:MAG: Crp/Fnr family transcriptional regulator [Clostridia bacterium]|nr:Crp/Fnr family transcriptional regulator [Clostridia bacterium]
MKDRKNAKHVKALRSSGLFEGLTDSEFGTILGQGEFRELGQGDCAVSEDSLRSGIGVVLSGELHAFNRSGGKSAALNRFCRGDVFGVATMWRSGEAYPSYVVAKRQSAVFLLDEKAVEAAIAGIPGFALAYARFLTGRIRFLNRKIAGFTSRNVKERLLQYVRINCGECGGRFALNVSAAADRLAVTRPALYNALKALCDEGIVAKDGKYVFLVTGAGEEKNAAPAGMN